jgi:hypothetical protein
VAGGYLHDVLPSSVIRIACGIDTEGLVSEWKRGQMFEWGGIRYVAQDDEIIKLLSEAAIFERVGSCSLREAFLVALECQRITVADLPTPVGLVGPR